MASTISRLRSLLMFAPFACQADAMNEILEGLTPKERLAISREALVLQLHGGRLPPAELTSAPQEIAEPPASPGFVDRFTWGPVARNVVRRWWRRHPANAAGQLALPLLERYARKEPAKLMAAAAATGALIVLVKPWRLLSITALIAAVLKTSDMADMVTTLMRDSNSSPRKEIE